MKFYTWSLFQAPTWGFAKVQVVSSFWKKVWNRPLDGCWIWAGSHTRGDYGRYNGPWLQEFAHRLSYEMNVGALEKDGVACHRCDTPPCVNPAHLFRGSSSLNSLDMHAKGRARWRLHADEGSRLRTFGLIVDARAFRWTADLVASNGGCPSGLSGVRCRLPKCFRCRRREQVIGLHMVREKFNYELDKNDPTYLLRLLTDEERGYVEEVAHG